VITLDIYGQKIRTTKVRIWKDEAWRAKCLVEGRPLEVSYPAEFGPRFLRFVADSIFDSYRVIAILRGES
jgi:hypothetical protein